MPYKPAFKGDVTKLDYDKSVRVHQGIDSHKRNVVGHGWGAEFLYDCPDAPLLVALRKDEPDADAQSFRLMLFACSHSWCTVGAETARALGIVGWLGVRIIPEQLYLTAMADLRAAYASDATGAYFTGALDEIRP